MLFQICEEKIMSFIITYRNNLAYLWFWSMKLDRDYLTQLSTTAFQIHQYVCMYPVSCPGLFQLLFHCHNYCFVWKSCMGSSKTPLIEIHTKTLYIYMYFYVIVFHILHNKIMVTITISWSSFSSWIRAFAKRETDWIIITKSCGYELYW